MDSFKKTTIIVASVILFILLLLTYFLINNDKKQLGFPPVLSKCPDYFLAREDNGKLYCDNVKKLGTCNPFDNVDMNTAYNGNYGSCLKKQNSDRCALSWDGITNNKDLCNSQ